MVNLIRGVVRGSTLVGGRRAPSIATYWQEILVYLLPFSMNLSRCETTCRVTSTAGRFTLSVTRQCASSLAHVCGTYSSSGAVTVLGAGLHGEAKVRYAANLRGIARARYARARAAATRCVSATGAHRGGRGCCCDASNGRLTVASRAGFTGRDAADLPLATGSAGALGPTAACAKWRADTLACS